MGNEPSNGTKEYPYGTYNGGLARDVLAFGPIQREGYGEMKWNDGAVYRGYWKKNEMDGPNGTLTFPNGNVYTGDFYKNNPHGNGILTTANGERISGIWEFQGRADNIDTRYTQPVGRYLLNVTVHDEKTNRAQQYIGPATLHLTSGLVVLPGMNDPSEPIFAYAVAIKNDDGELRKVDYVAEATPVALGSNAQPFVPITSNGAVQQPPVASMGSIPAGPVASAVPEAPLQQAPGVAYGFHDPALNTDPNRQYAARPRYHFLDPRNYF